MRVTEHEMRSPMCVVEPSAAVEPDADADWAIQTRRVLTRDLLLRAARAQPGESRALQFRALHLNLPLIDEVAERLGLSAPERGRLEHAALDGLAEAIREFDPAGPDEFAVLACSLIERQVVARRAVPRATARQLRQAIRRLMVAEARNPL